MLNISANLLSAADSPMQCKRTNMEGEPGEPLRNPSHDGGGCCVHVATLTWERPVFSWLIETMRYPSEHLPVWYALGGLTLATVLAGIVGAMFSWKRHADRYGRVLVRGCSRLLCCCRQCRTESQQPMVGPAKVSEAEGHEVRAKKTKAERNEEAALRAMGAAIEAFLAFTLAASFWFNVLNLVEMGENEDTRARPYFMLEAFVLCAACVASCALACVLGLQAAVDHESMLDTKAFSSALPLWPWLVLLSFLASPGLLKLLPWRIVDHEGFPTRSSQRVAALIPAVMGGAIATMEAVYWIAIGAETDSVFFFSFGFNLLLFLRQRLVHLFRILQRRLSAQPKQRVGAGKRLLKDQDFSGFLDRTNEKADSEENEVAVNPIMLYRYDEKRRKDREKKLQKAANAEGLGSGGRFRTGGLRRLNLGIEEARRETDEMKLNAYLKGMLQENVSSSVASSSDAVEGSVKVEDASDAMEARSVAERLHEDLDRHHKLHESKGRARDVTFSNIKQARQSIAKAPMRRARIGSSSDDVHAFPHDALEGLAPSGGLAKLESAEEVAQHVLMDSGKPFEDQGLGEASQGVLGDTDAGFLVLEDEERRKGLASRRMSLGLHSRRM